MSKADLPSDRTLADCVGGVKNLEGSCGWPHGDTVIAELDQRLGLSECLRVIDELESHVATMGIAPRFRRDIFFNQQQSRDPSRAPLTSLDINFGNGFDHLNEAGHKRAALLIAMQRVRTKLMVAFSDLQRVRLDIEATNMDDNGTHIPKPSADVLELDNLVTIPS